MVNLEKYLDVVSNDPTERDYQAFIEWERAHRDANPQREKSILNERERRYYLGEDVVEPKTQAERSLRQNVRDRFTSGVLDLSLLAREMDDRDLDQSFERSFEPQVGDGTSIDLGTTFLRAAITLAYRHVGDVETLEAEIATALETVAMTEGRLTEFDVTIDEHLETTGEEVLEKMEGGEVASVTQEEGELLLASGIAERENVELQIKFLETDTDTTDSA